MSEFNKNFLEDKLTQHESNVVAAIAVMKSTLIALLSWVYFFTVNKLFDQFSVEYWHCYVFIVISEFVSISGEKVNGAVKLLHAIVLLAWLYSMSF